jgi:hypothetical protein
MQIRTLPCPLNAWPADDMTSCCVDVIYVVIFRYNGYDTNEYAKVVERYEQVEALRQELKVKEQVELLYQQGKAEQAAAAAAALAAAAAAGDADGVAAEVDAADDAKIADDEDAGEVGGQGGVRGGGVR